MLFPGLVAHALQSGGFRIPLRQVGPALLVAILLAVLYRHAGAVFGASPSAPLFSLGKLEVPSIAEPVRLLAADAAQLIVLFSGLTLCGLAAMQIIFADLGRHSLEIYLFHQPIYIALLTASRKLGIAAGDIGMGLVLFALTLALAFAMARLLAGFPGCGACCFRMAPRTCGGCRRRGSARPCRSAPARPTRRPVDESDDARNHRGGRRTPDEDSKHATAQRETARPDGCARDPVGLRAERGRPSGRADAARRQRGGGPPDGAR
ncbi:acyltransferase family protein [Methylobacterium tardum]|uniref:acyltransferase family protein n=1 Tax=Methylobacterium tardum TaxID=374432 RepID=UPI00361F28EE